MNTPSYGIKAGHIAEGPIRIVGRKVSGSTDEELSI